MLEPVNQREFWHALCVFQLRSEVVCSLAEKRASGQCSVWAGQCRHVQDVCAPASQFGKSRGLSSMFV
jgi:hypothetical protein